MKKNNTIKKQKKGWIVLMIILCGLFVNTAMGQRTFTWNGSVSTDWATAANWTPSGSGSTSTYPGESTLTNVDWVVISSNSTPNAPIITTSPPSSVARVTISNATGTIAGPTLTINSGATLLVRSASITNVSLTGGKIVNNGTLDILSTATAGGGIATTGIICNTPTQPPTSNTTYGYSGNGTLNIDVSASTTAASAAISVPSANAFAIYSFLINATPSLKLSTGTNTCFAVRSSNISPVIIGGTGFTIGSAGIPSNGGLLGLGGASTVIIESGTNLTFYSKNTNLARQMSVFNSASTTTTVTNRGNINILGDTTNTPIFMSTGAGTNAPIFNLINEGTLNIDLVCSNIATGPLGTGNGGGKSTGTGVGFFITNSGTLTLKNRSTTVGRGSAIAGSSAGEAPPLTITNSGVLNLEGSTSHAGFKTSIINNGIINSNSDFVSFSSIVNNTTGTFNFKRTASSSTNKQVTFTVADTALSNAGTTYTADGFTFTVTNQKFSFPLPNPLITNVVSNATVSPTGTLTLASGTGDASIAYTAVANPTANNAFTSGITNNGIINTDTGSNLNIIPGVTTTANSIIAPGGSAGKGIVDFAKGAATLSGKTILQISGSAAAGVDYDQITNSAIAGTLAVSGTLDITGIYTPAGPVTIDIVTTEATGDLSGNFGTVIGITTGWSVVATTGVGGKIQLVYDPLTPATSTTWTGGTSTGWINALNWSNGVPDQNSDVTIANGTFQPSPFVNVSIKSLTIDSGSTLTINSTYNFTVKEAITNNGTLTVLNNANLIQVDNVSNGGAGTTTVNRNSNALSRLDYTIWSSPVTGTQKLTDFSPLTSQSPSRFYNYAETANQYTAIASPTTTTFAAGSGYLIRMPNDAVPAPATQTFAGVFSGVPNNGTITNPITYGGAALGYNLVGNPYPSTIDAQAFITANTTNIESSLYFWRKINGATGSSYAVYNPLGATTATPSSAVPNGTIQVGQGFFVKAKSASNVSFTNAMRVANNSNQFFKTKQVQKDRLWLNLTGAADAFSQALVGYTADATLAVDMYDAKYINDSPIALTSSINNEEYTIQGRPAFDASDVVALNFKTDLAGDYTIALDHFDGVFATGQDVYLLDNTTGAETNLKNGSYTFNATAGIDNSRFSLKYQKTLKVDEPKLNENTIRVYKNNGTLYVNSGSIAISSISVFDVQGRLLSEQRNVKANTATIKDQRALNQVLIVKIVGEDNSEVTKKVLN
ncbi:T9SS sorting signal type C domain-containing protein [Flavobacterium nackdongense]|uniref:T9SS sorting signal type C domain-containing protein n=1 Tax=Flavobacterium nackdongense TaxID=2547394 RepID=A0A4P6YHN6_9FLAO|nr:T9SS sorting signal type C domain-containing protein [Flavobacterium nackdongense]QBN20375.1 T9SS sorting signal type C domain-containing protein [Flavobacterium nackdongense]